MRLRARPVAAVILLVWSASVPVLNAQGGKAGAVPDGLRASVLKLTGPEPADCGQHLLTRPFATAGAPELQKSLACSLEASKARKPFWTVQQHQGIDSLVFEGFLGTADGVVQHFFYDSAPCGGPGCAANFKAERCEKPTVGAQGNVARFECAR